MANVQKIVVGIGLVGLAAFELKTATIASQYLVPTQDSTFMAKLFGSPLVPLLVGAWGFKELLAGLSAGSNTPNRAPAKTPTTRTAKQMFFDAEALEAVNDYAGALDTYRVLIATHPAAPEAADAKAAIDAIRKQRATGA